MKVELLEGGKMPIRGTKIAAGFDCFAREVKLSGYSATINLGFKIDCNSPFLSLSENNFNFAAYLMPRSGWGAKYGFRLKNTLGLVDPDYRGEVIAKVQFDECPQELAAFANSKCNGCDAASCVPCSIYKDGCDIQQPKVCQMVIAPYFAGYLQKVDSLDGTERGAGGFGSTDT